jgi:LPXTG-motif cell wall-anchored protein
MFRKVSLSLVLAVSAACFGQISTTGGYATTSSAPMTPITPIISTPDIALPGSGPAVGAPLSNTNDPRTSTGPSIYDPNYVSPASESAQGAAFTPSNATSANENFEVGIQHFVSGAPAATTPTRSLAEIARSIKAQHPKARRSFNNDTIAKLNADGVRTGNLEPTEVAQAPAEENTLVAENRVPALPQSDQAETTQVRPSQNSATAAQQRQRVEAPSETTAAAPAPAPPQASAPGDHAENTAKLPQTSSYLPLILFLGALGIAGGALYFLRR